MAIWGNNATPSFGFISSGSNNTGAYLVPGTFPGGTINQVHVYAATFTGSTSAAVLCIWNTAGILLFSDSGLFANTTLAWMNGHSGLSVPLAAQQIFIGVSMPTANGIHVEYAAASGQKWELALISSPPGNIGSFTNETGEAMGAYIDYTPTQRFINTGTPASPIWTPNTSSSAVNTNTPASPVWTHGVRKINTGTPASPVWTVVS